MKNKNNEMEVYVDLSASNHFKELCKNNKVAFEEQGKYNNHLMKFIIYE